MPVEEQRRARRTVLVLAVPLLLLAVAAVAVLARPPAPPFGGDPPAPEPPVSVPLPGAGEPLLLWLDGTPAFVVADRAGDVHAVEALTPGHPPGTRYAVGWCRPAARFVSLTDASVFHVDGAYHGGPSATGLATFAVEVRGDRAVVGDRRPARPRDPRRTEGPAGLPGGPPGEWSEECLGPMPDPDSLVVHDWPSADVTRPEEAVARRDARRVLVRGRLAVDGAAARLCGHRVGAEAARGCPLDAPLVRGVRQPAGWEREVYDGLWRVGMEGGEIVALTHLRTWLVLPEAEPRRTGSPPERSLVAGDALTVYTFDLGYSDPPPAVAPGGYELRLANYGNLPHTLVNDDLGVRVEASGGKDAVARVHLPAGDHRFWCDIPGHRAAGMEFRLTVRE